MKILKWLLLSFLLPIALNAQTAEEYFKLGNNAYKAQDYIKAESDYLEALKLNPSNPDLLFNLGNTYVKLNKAPYAQLSYMRALYLNPRMREASANLEILAKDASLEIPELNGAIAFYNELSILEWTLLAFTSLWLAILFLIVPPLYFKKSPVWIFTSLICAITLLVSSFGIYNWMCFADTAVAMKDDVPLRISPVENAPVSARLSAGQISQVKKTLGDYLYIETDTGKCGWAKFGDVEPVSE